MEDLQYNPIEPQPIYVARAVGTPAPRIGVPVVTLVLILANFLMAGAQFAVAGFRSRGDTIGSNATDWALGAKVPSLVAHGEWWRLVTANFLHGSWWPHLLGNMLGLLVVGTLIEAYYGRTRTLIIYTLSSVTGAIASYFLTPSVSLGASTGIMGLMGAILIHYLKQYQDLPERVRVVLPFLMIVLLVQFGLDSLHQQQVDLYGHAGGLLGGMLMAFLLASQGGWTRTAQRDRVPLPAALATALGLLAYGGYGLLSTLPAEGELIRAGESSSAVGQSSHLERVVEHRPYFVEAQLALGDLLKTLNRDDEAAVHYKLALDNDPKNHEIHHRLKELSQSYVLEADRDYNSRQWEEAARNYRRALQYPGQKEVLAEAHNGYAWVLADKLNRNLDEADKHAREALKLQPNSEAIIDTLAWVQYKQGRFNEALEEQLKAVRLMEGRRMLTGTSEMYYHLGAIYEGLERKSEARFYYTRAINGQPPSAPARAALRRLEGNKALPAPDPRELLPDPATSRGII